MLVELNETNFDESLSKGLKLVEFFAPWCSHCQHQAPVLKEFDKIWIGQVDGDNSQLLSKRFNIQGFPTFILFKDGKEQERFSGFHTKFQIMDIIMPYLK